VANAPFLISIFLGAFLLFQVQPIMGRFVLPRYGGGPQVWTACMLFFQVLLVGGYAYAHWLGSRANTRLQSWIHIALLASSLVFLPLTPRFSVAYATSAADPSLAILAVLALSIGGPYLLLSATGPLLQRWFHLSHPDQSPWRLYSLSNLGSFLALLTYPFAVEPFLRLQTQAGLWSILYVAFAIICSWTAWRLHPTTAPAADREPESAPPTLATIALWIGLAAAGSTLLLATTNLISQDVAVIPFLWVAPLSIYLLTFVLVFEHERWYHRFTFATAAGILAPAGCAIMVAAIAISPWWQLAVYLAALFVACMVCHGELSLSRPARRYLTTFYLAIAIGGALGGVFVALLAPRIFTEFNEYPIALAAACFLGFAGWMRSGALRQWTSRNLAIRVPLMALLIGGLSAIVTVTSGNKQPILAAARNFYGILRLTERPDGSNGPFRQLTHGRIRHGLQFQREPQRSWPTSYYGPHSGAAIALTALDAPSRRIAVVGLGAGTLAAWGRPGDSISFYEINPQVVDMAHTWFSYLQDSKAATDIVLGDARVQLERELRSGSPQPFDVIAVDAFSSDAIPLHLLTAECADIYRHHLAPGGVILLHISNILLNLDPVARGFADHLGWKAALFMSPEDESTGESAARWVVITANESFLRKLGITNDRATWPANDPRLITWTDDFASLWHVLKF